MCCWLFGYVGAIWQVIRSEESNSGVGCQVIRSEESLSNIDQCRVLFKRAIGSVADAAAVGREWLAFEREHGSIDELELAMHKATNTPPWHQSCIDAPGTLGCPTGSNEWPRLASHSSMRTGHASDTLLLENT